MGQNRTTDMTKGNVLRHILLFAIPLFIGNIFQQFYNVMDTVIAGHFLGDDALAAVGATSTLSSLIIGFSSGMNTGYGIVWSRLFGAKETGKLKHAIGVSLILNVGLIAVLTTASLVGLRPLLYMMNVPESIFERSYQYIFVILSGLGITLLYNMEAGILRAIGNSRVPLYFVIFASVLNIGFNLILILVVHMDVAGLALGTVLAQACCVSACFVYIKKNYPELKLERKDFKIESNLLSDLFTSGIAMGLMLSIFSIGSVILQSAINSLDKTIITAHTAARRVVEIFMQPLGTLATSIATFVSQNHGAGKRKRIVEGIRVTCIASLVWSAFSFVMIQILDERLVYWLTGTHDQEVLSNAVMNIHINLDFFFFLGILLILRSALQGFGHKIAPLIASSIELAMKVFAKFVLVPRYGYKGASITEPSTWLMCMAFLLIVIWVERKEFR